MENNKDLIARLFDAMRCDLGVMAEYGDNENELLHELKTATPEILATYKEIFL